MEKEYYVIYNGEILKGSLKYNESDGWIFTPFSHPNIRMTISALQIYQESFESYDNALMYALRNKSGTSGSVYVLNFDDNKYEAKHIKNFTRKYIHFAEDNNKISIECAAKYIFLTEKDVKEAIAKKQGDLGESHTTDTSSKYDEENPKYIILKDDERIVKGYPELKPYCADFVEFLVIEDNGEPINDRSTVTGVYKKDYPSRVFDTIKDAQHEILRQKIGDDIYIVNLYNTVVSAYTLYDILDDSILYKNSSESESHTLHSDYYDHVFFTLVDAERYIVKKTADKMIANVDDTGHKNTVYFVNVDGEITEHHYHGMDLYTRTIYLSTAGKSYPMKVAASSIKWIYYTKHEAEVAALDLMDACDVYIVDGGGAFLKKAKFDGCTKNNITVVEEYEGFSVTNQVLLKDDIGKKFFFNEKDAISSVIEKLVQPHAKERPSIRATIAAKLNTAAIYYYITPEKSILPVYGISNIDDKTYYICFRNRLIYEFSEGWAYRLFKNKRDAEYTILSSKCGEIIYVVDVDESHVDPYILCKTEPSSIICRKSADDDCTVSFDMSIFKDHIFYTEKDARNMYPMLVGSPFIPDDIKDNNIFNPNLPVIYPAHTTLYEQIKRQEKRKEAVNYGTIGSVFWYTAPEFIKPPYLACDGSIYNIADYGELCEFFKQTFGSINHWGGDGTKTFAVPDLRIHDKSPALWGMKATENKEVTMKENTDVKMDMYLIEYNINKNNFFVETYEITRSKFKQIVISHKFHNSLEYAFANKDDANEYARYLNNISDLLKETKIPKMGDDVWVFNVPINVVPYTKGVVLHSTYYEIIVDTLDGDVKHYSPFDIGYVLFTEKPTDSITAKIVDKLKNQILTNFHQTYDNNYNPPVLFTVEIQKMPALTDIGIVANTFDSMSCCNNFIERCKKNDDKFFYTEEAAQKYKEFLCNSINKVNDAFYKYPEVGDRVLAENLVDCIDGMLIANIISVDHLNAEFYVKLDCISSYLGTDNIIRKYNICDIGSTILYKINNIKTSVNENKSKKLADKFDTSIRIKEVVDLFDSLINDGFEITTCEGKLWIINPNGTMSSSTILPDSSGDEINLGKIFNDRLFIIVNGEIIESTSYSIIGNKFLSVQHTLNGMVSDFSVLDLNKSIFQTREDAERYLKMKNISINKPTNELQDDDTVYFIDIEGKIRSTLYSLISLGEVFFISKDEADEFVKSHTK